MSIIHISPVIPLPPALPVSEGQDEHGPEDHAEDQPGQVRRVVHGRIGPVIQGQGHHVFGAVPALVAHVADDGDGVGDGFGGSKVSGAISAKVGDSVTVYGTLDTVDGERVIR